MNTHRIELPHCHMDAYVPALSITPKKPRPTIIICPGGGYRFTSEREAEPIALVFAAMGFNAFVVYYRVAPNRYPDALQDVASAVAYVRAHIDEYRGSPDTIAVAGFSAGGHAACSLGVRWHDAPLMAQLGFTPEQVRPNAMVLCYPVITAGEFAHRGSFEQLLGTEDIALHQAQSLETLVTENTPPTFLWHTWEDGSVPCENSLLMSLALHRNGVSGEVHIFPHGGHGLALANDLTDSEGRNDKIVQECAVWPDLAGRFLKDMMS